MTALLSPNLTGVPETLLWTLHNRATEAMRPDGILRDDKAIEIYKSLDYDYERSFGKGEPSHAVRALVFDSELQAFLQQHPDGVIVNLGEGLETQRYRITSPQALWLCVEIPEAIAIRERFIQPDAQHLHIACSALDTQWFDSVPPDRAVYITAQGLLMYFTAAEVEKLLQAMATRFPHARFAFDHIPIWFSNKTVKGWRKTQHYQTPPMPWGINVDQVEPTLRTWVPNLAEVKPLPYSFPRGAVRLITAVWSRLPMLKYYLYGMTRVQFGK